MYLILIILTIVSTATGHQYSCYGRRRKNNMAANMKQFHLWRNVDISRVSGCAKVCYQDSMCCAFQYSRTSKTCVGYQHGMIPTSWRDTGFWHYEFYNCSNDCDRFEGFIYDVSPMCFKYVRTPANWPNARARCRKDKTDLIVVDEDRKLESILKFMSRLKLKRLWVGMQTIISTNPKEKFIYRWLNNSTYIPVWAEEEPDRNTIQMCGQLNVGGMSDMYCWVNRTYFCEKNITK